MQKSLPFARGMGKTYRTGNGAALRQINPRRVRTDGGPP